MSERSLGRAGESKRVLVESEFAVPVIIEVADCHAVISVHIDPNRAVEDGSPIIGSSHQLLSVRLRAPQRLRCDVNKKLSGASGDGLAGRGPLRDFPFSAQLARPGEKPRANPLFAAPVVAAYELIANLHVESKWPISGWRTTVDFKISRFDALQGRQIRFDLCQEASAACEHIGIEFSAPDVNPAGRTQSGLSNGSRRTEAQVFIQKAG